MHHSTIYFHLRFLSSSLFFFSIFSHVTGTVNTAFCSHGSCTLPNAIPTGCLPAPTAPPVRRRELHLRRAAPSIDYNEPSFVEIERKQEDVPTMQQDIKVILGRGNPICYYPSTVLGTWLKDGFTTETFVLPVGRYAVKWIERYANPEAAAATSKCTASLVSLSPCPPSLVPNLSLILLCHLTRSLYLHSLFQALSQRGPQPRRQHAHHTHRNLR